MKITSVGTKLWSERVSDQKNLGKIVSQLEFLHCSPHELKAAIV